MAYTRTKEIPPGSGNHYLYLVESYREGGKVKQRVIEYLGRDFSSAGGGYSRKQNVQPYRLVKDGKTVYYGITSQELEDRENQHRDKGKIKIEAIGKRRNIKEAQDWEAEVLKKYRGRFGKNPAYNKTQR